MPQTRCINIVVSLSNNVCCYVACTASSSHLCTYQVRRRDTRTRTYHMYMYQMFAHWRLFLFPPRGFPCSLGCGARMGTACTLGESVGPGWAPWRVWAIKVA